MKKFFILLSLVPFYSHSATLPDGRSNVMECTHDEVVAYMELPDQQRQALTNYKAWENAYKSSEMKKSEEDPNNCIGLLYGDLEDIAENVKNATNSLMSMSLPSMNSVLSSLGDKLMEGICSRVEAVDDEFSEKVMDNYNALQDEAKSKITQRYGQKAMESHITDALVSPEYKSMGLKYRNGKIDRDSFRRSVKNRWQNELNELEDSVVD